MHKKFEINRTKIKVGCQSEGKVVPHNSKSDMPLAGERRAVGVFALTISWQKNNLF